jgi:hypothetical protein
MAGNVLISELIMITFELSNHAIVVMRERKIEVQFVSECLDAPDLVDQHDDGTVHYCRKLVDCDGRWLRVVVNPGKTPLLVITAFFDRRLRRDYDNRDR